MIKPELLKILVCPICKNAVELDGDYLLCQTDKVKYPIKNDIPVMLKEEAIPLDSGKCC